LGSGSSEKIEYKNSKFAVIENPVAGTWNIKYDFPERGSFLISGISNFSFEFGFSEGIPKQMVETTFLPKKGLLLNF
jgi:hypothetical protein